MLYSLIVGCWVASEIFLNRVFRSGKDEKQKADKRSLLIIWLTIAVCLPFTSIIGRWLPWPIHNGIQPIGLTLIVAGMIFRVFAVYTLGRYFTVDVTIRNDHRIVKRGLYRFLRHPSYLGSLVSFLGNGLALNNWAALALSLLPVLVAFLYRIQVEEQLLIQNFGQDYLDYKKETWRLVPFIY
jgi:protein-S-isoprenylcysteine O-methyltransferase Ste14